MPVKTVQAFQDLAEDLRMVSVGIQLYGKAQVPDPGKEVRQIPVQAGLSPCDGHSVQKAPPLFQEGKELLLFHNGRGASVHQLVVVTEGAAEIAHARKDRAGFPGPGGGSPDGFRWYPALRQSPGPGSWKGSPANPCAGRALPL